MGCRVNRISAVHTQPRKAGDFEYAIVYRHEITETDARIRPWDSR